MGAIKQAGNSTEASLGEIDVLGLTSHSCRRQPARMMRTMQLLATMQNRSVKKNRPHQT